MRSHDPHRNDKVWTLVRSSFKSNAAGDCFGLLNSHFQSCSIGFRTLVCESGVALLRDGIPMDDYTWTMLRLHLTTNRCWNDLSWFRCADCMRFAVTYSEHNVGFVGGWGSLCGLGVRIK